MGMARVKFYVVGLGSIGLRHAQNLLAMGHEVWGHDTHAPAEDVAATYGVKLWGRESAPPVDAMVIASPTINHFDQLLVALYYKKPVFVEKPIVHTEHLQGAAELVQKLNTLVAVGNNLRFHPAVRGLKKDILEEKLGVVQWAFLSCAQYNDRPEYMRDGVTLNWGAHEIDLALHLFGPARVEAYSVDRLDTIADLCLTHGEWYGTRSVIHLDYITEPELRTTMVFGTKGQAALDLPQRTSMLSYDGKPQYLVGAGGYDTDYYDEMKAFADAVEGKAPWPGATASEALEVVKIINDAKQLCPK